MAAGNNNVYKKDGKEATYCQVFSYLSETYVTDEFITEAKAWVANLKWAAGMPTIRFSEAPSESVSA